MNQKIFKNSHLPYILIILFLGLTPLLWFKSGFIVAGHDSGLPLDPIAHFLDRLYLWTHRYGIGSNQSFAAGGFFIHGLEALIAWLGFSLSNGQKVFFTIWFVLPGLAMYFLGNTISAEKKYRAAWLIASVFYMYNHFLLQAWFVAERTKFSLYIALPLILALFFRVNEQRTSPLKASLWVSIILFFLNGGGFLPLYGSLIISWMSAAVYFLFISPTQKTLKGLTLFSLLSVLFSLLINAYWIIPYGYSTIYSYSSTLDLVGGIDGVKGWIDVISQNSSYDKLLRLQGIQEWYVNPLHPYAKYFLNNPLVLLISFLIPVIAYLSIFTIRDKIKKYVIFFAFLSLVSMVFSAGSQPPFGFLYIFLVEHVPGFAIFRTPFYKFATGIWLSYALLIGLSVNYLIQEYSYILEKVKGYYLVLGAIIAGIILYSFPFLNGSFFDYETGIKSTRIEVPEYVFSVNDQLNKITGHDSRTLLLPEHSQSINIEAYKWGFWSLATVPSLLSDRSFVSNNITLDLNEKTLINILYNKIAEKDLGWAKLANLLSIDGFLVRNDFDWSQDRFNTRQPKEYEDSLLASNLVDKKIEAGEWKYYQMKDKKGDFYISQDPIFITGGIFDLNSIITLNEIKDNSVLILTDKANEQLFAEKDFLPRKSFINIAQCARCDLSKTPMFLPGVDWFGSGSIFYSWTKKKEQEDLNKISTSAEKINFATVLVNKRLVSVYATYFQKKSWEEKVEVLNEYNIQLRALLDIISESPIGSVLKYNDEILIVEDYLQDQRRGLEDLYQHMTTSDEESAMESTLVTINEILTKVDNIGWRTKDEISKKYLVNVTEGSDYKLLLDSLTLSTQKDIARDNYLNLDINNQQATLSAIVRPDNRWVEAQTVNLSDGIQKFIFNGSKESNFVANILATLAVPSNVSREANNIFKITSDGEERCLAIPLPKAESESKYLIEFSSKRIQGRQDLIYYVSDGLSHKSSLSKNVKVLKITPYLEKNFDEVRLLPGESRVLNFCNKLDREVNLTSINQIENIAYRKITAPIIAFVKEDQDTKVNNAEINSKRINNTKYEVKLTADESSYIVFSQRFDPGWVIYPKKDTANFSDNFISTIILDPQPDKMLLHFKANGVLNGWLVPGTGDQEYIIEYLPQRFFYRSVIITIISVILIVSLIFSFWIRRKYE